LAAEVQAGRFREDLFYRLSVFPLQWQSLRERPLDIIPLAQKLLGMHTRKMGRVSVVLDKSAHQALLEHSWPGNVRELDNVVQRALIMQQGTVISDFHLRLDPFDHSPRGPSAVGAAVQQVHGAISSSSAVDIAAEDSGALGDDLQRREFEIIVDTLKMERGSRKNTAEKLGISPRTLRYKLARMRDEGINFDRALGAL